MCWAVVWPDLSVSKAAEAAVLHQLGIEAAFSRMLDLQHVSHLRCQLKRCPNTCWAIITGMHSDDVHQDNGIGSTHLFKEDAIQGIRHVVRL